MNLHPSGNWVKKTIVYCSIFFLSLIWVTAQAQTSEITGTVSDESGSSLPGVNVVVKGTSQGTVTDVDGNYSISVEGESTILVFSYVGYTQEEIAVGSQSVINVSLTPDVTALSEIVVIGYGTAKKSDVTGAISSVSSQTIKEIPAQDVSTALQGRVAGVDIQKTSSRPGAEPQIRIRGNRSLGSPDGGNNEPLIVLDGIPYLGSLTSISQGDIESVDILKDASATAIYGSRGSNGVIIITTKKGKAGQSRFSYNGFYGVSTPLDEYDVFNGEEFANYVLEANTNPLTADETESVLMGREVNWQDLIYDNGMKTNHELSFSGGTDKTQYLASGAYWRETSAMPGQAFTRYQLRLSVDHQASKRIKIGANTLTSYSVRNGAGTNPGGLQSFSPLMKPYTDEGEVNDNFYAGHIDEPFNINPLVYFDEDAWEDQSKKIVNFTSLYGEIEIIEGLRYRLNVGTELEFTKEGVFRGSRLNVSNNNSANISNSHAWSYTLENLLLFDRTFADKHQINFTGLFSVQENEWAQQGFSTTDLASDQLQYYNLGLGGTILPQAQNYSKWGLLSYMARINYGFDDRFLLTLTGRMDGSSRLAEGNKWFTYPAAAVAWNIKNESFMGNTDFMSNLKLRLGWGTTSNQAISPYQSLGRLSSLAYSYGPDGGLLGYYVSNLPNQDLTWEFSSTYNLGLDFGFFGDRLNGSVEVYQTETSDILQNRTLPIMSGVSGTFQQNVGSTETKGLEITLNALAIKSAQPDGFQWELDLNFTSWKEEITQLYDTLRQDINNGWFVGQPIDVVYDYKKIGIWQLDEEEEAADFESGLEPGDIRVADLNENGIRDEDDRSVLGKLNPDWMGGLTSQMSYKNFDFSVVLFARVGGLVVSRTHQVASLEGRRNQIAVDYWTPDNPTNAYPKTGDQFPQFSSTMGYFDGTYMKIRTINLGYNVPKTFLDKIGINSARVYFTADTPFKAFFSDLVDAGMVDPEPNGRGDTQTPGFGNRLRVSDDSPVMKSYIVGLNFEF
jgi:TonB-linked SusC/RagA family outer membrane protein